MDNKSLANKVTVVVFSRILTSFIDFTTGVLIVRLLSETNFAILAYLLIVYEVARYVATLGFPESIFYYFEQLAKNYRKAFAIQTFGILLVTGLLSAIAILLVEFFAPSLISQFSPEVIETIQEYLPYIALIALLEIPTWPVTNILLALDKQKQSGWYQVITSLMSFMALILPIVLGMPFVWILYALLSYAAIRFVGSIIWMAIVLPGGELRTPKNNIREQISFSIPLGVSSLVNQFNKNIDRFVVSFFLTEFALGQYHVGAQEVPIIRVIPFAVGSVLISRYVNFNIHQRREDLINLWHKSIEKVALLIIPLTIMFIVAAPEIISFVIETEETDYSGAIIPFQIYNLIVLIRVAHYGSMLQAFGDTRGILRLSLMLLGFNLVLSIPLTYYVGINGTALGTLIANLLYLYFILKRIGGHLQVPFYRVLPLLKYFRILALSSVIGIIIYVAKGQSYWQLSDGLTLLYSMLSFLLAYLVIGTMLNIIKKSDWKLFINALTLRFFWEREKV
jgi:O-antigen/teichoic acid export membrane protein